MGAPHIWLPTLLNHTRSFPSDASEKSAAAYINHAIVCDLPRLKKPPPKRTTLPFPAFANNIVKRLSSGYWITIRQVFFIHVWTTHAHHGWPKHDSGGTPHAHISTCPLTRAVEARLHRDVELGILEPVPIGTPVTWCSGMVIVSKKSGEPRRTILISKPPISIQEVRHTTRHCHPTWHNLFPPIPGLQHIQNCPRCLDWLS